MTTPNQYQEFVRAKVAGAITEARAASTLTHQGVKGTVLEILISRLFRPLLPSDVGVGTGQIIESYRGLLSNQVDVILYDKSILPPALYDEQTGIFPIEAVLYAIEVKTTLDSTGLQIAHESAKRLNSFCYLPGLTNADGTARNHKIEHARSAIIALNSDLLRQSEAKRYHRIYSRNKEKPFLRAICVIGKEYLYDNGENWVTVSPHREFDEVLAFLGGVTNTYKDVSRSRHQPRLGNYIIPDCDHKKGIVSREIIRVTITCEDCGINFQFKPNLERMDITVNGAITSSDPCPKCGGKMKSRKGTYVFRNGELQADA